MQRNEVVNEETRWHIGRALAAPKHTFSNPILLTQTVTFILCQAKANQSVPNVIRGQFGWSSSCERQPFLQSARRIAFSLSKFAECVCLSPLTFCPSVPDVIVMTLSYLWHAIAGFSL